MSHNITVVSEGSFIYDLCLIRDDYTVLNNCAITKNSFFSILFYLPCICEPLSITTCMSSLSFLWIFFIDICCHCTFLCTCNYMLAFIYYLLYINVLMERIQNFILCVDNYTNYF